MAAGPGGSPSAPAGAHGGALAFGQPFGAYEIHRLLGRGGMGEVYEAEETASGRRIALKLFNRPLGNPTERDRFLREGQLAASISHPNSVYIFGTDEIQGMPVIAMELAPGGTLKDAVGRRGPLPASEAVDAILQVIDGLEAAAAVGVLHRDVKPANCFVDRDGAVKVGDFGLSISTLARDETHLTMAGTILGTPAFASPEQMRGDALDLRSDIYSVGATLYYLLTGRAPFEEANLVKLVGQVLSDAPASPRAVRPEVPRRLAAVVLACLKKAPADRPQTYSALRQALLPFSSQAPTPATLGLRFAANVVDTVVLAVLSLQSVLKLFRLVRELTSSSAASASSITGWDTVGGLAIAIAYFALTEGLWGRSPGKALFGLRVVDAGRQVPGVRRALVRACVFLATQRSLELAFMFAYGGPAAYLVETTRPGGALWLGFAPITLSLLGVAIAFSTARRSNGYAGLHDLASGTRVASKSAIAAAVVTRTADQAVAAPPGARVIGPYMAVDTPARPRADVVVGYDPRLRRNVWIRPQPARAGALPTTRRDLARKGRLRWLTGHRAPDGSWDAFEAINGRPFAAAIERPQPWRVVRAWLRDLADEINAASKDATLPTLGLDTVWVGADGRVRLLDFGDAAAEIEPGAMQDFLLLIARSALAGRAAASASEARGLPTGPIPIPAWRLLEELSAHRFSSPQEAATALEESSAGRSEISRGLRAGHLALTLLVPLLALPGMGIYVATDWQRAEITAWLNVLARSETPRGDGLSPEAREAATTYAASLLPSDTSRFESRHQPVIERLRRAHSRVTPEERRQAEASLARLGVRRDVIVAREKRTILFVGGFTPFFLWSCLALVAVIGAAIGRGGLALPLFGIAVVRQDGARASRFRCFMRSLVAWLPVLAAGAGWIALLVFGLDRGPKASASLFTNPAAAAALLLVEVVFVGVFVAGAVRAVLRPERGWQDRIAGTYLVPK